MDKKELIYTILNKYSCLSSKEISNLIKRLHSVDITPSSVSGCLRVGISKGEIGKSNCGNGKTVYWRCNINE